MRFGLDVAQQRMPWDELVRRVQLAEELGFDGVWGFDHFQPMYGEGPGETFEGMTTLAALAGVTTRIRLGLLVTGVTYRHPSVFAAQALTIDHVVARTARAVARRGLVRQGAPRARHPVPADARAVRAARGRARDRDAPLHRRRGHLRGTRRVAARRAAAADTGAATASTHLDRRDGPAPHAAPRGQARRRVARLRYAELAARGLRARSTSSRSRRAATRPTSSAPGRSRSTTSTRRARHAAKWRDAGYGYLVCGWPAAGAAQVERFAREVMPDLA